MNDSLPSEVIAAPPDRPAIYWPGLACWLPLCLAAAVVWGGLTVLIQAYFSPLLLFPLAVGAVLGVIGAAALRLCRLAHRPTAIAGALAAACLLVWTQHYVSYRLARSATDQQKNMSLAQAAFPELDLNFTRYLASEAAKGRPIAGFVARGAQAWISWGIDGLLVIPQFVINELQGIADSSDRIRRSRGRRGLDILNRLRESKTVDVQIFGRDLPEFADQVVDLKLVALARHLSGKLVTNDYNLNKVAQLQDVAVINLNDLANAMKPSFLPGEQISVRVVKAGEEHGQGIGYLDDGTMVVIEAGREHIGQEVTVGVTSVIQKSAGRMVFGRFDGGK